MQGSCDHTYQSVVLRLQLLEARLAEIEARFRQPSAEEIANSQPSTLVCGGITLDLPAGRYKLEVAENNAICATRLGDSSFYKA